MERQILTVRTSDDLEAANRVIDGMVSGGEPLRPVRVVFEDLSVVQSMLDWGDSLDNFPLDIEVDGGGGTLRGEMVYLSGSRVSLSHIRLDAGGKEILQLQVSAMESIELDDVQFVGSAPLPTHRGVRRVVGAAWFESQGPAVRVTARNVSVLDAQGVGSVNFSNGGRSAFGQVTWANGRFGGCAAPIINFARVSTFSAPGTIHLGTGPYYRTLPGTVVLDDGDSRPPDDAVLAQWRAWPQAP